MLPFANTFATLAGVLYPAVETYRALGTENKEDDLQVILPVG
jgi:hypothetical protein